VQGENPSGRKIREKSFCNKRRQTEYSRLLNYKNFVFAGRKSYFEEKSGINRSATNDDRQSTLGFYIIKNFAYAGRKS
jgi:hypothetical protein